MELIASWRKDVTSAPRAGLAILIRPGLTYNVSHVYNEHDAHSNSVIQALTLNMGRTIRLTGVYMSRTTKGEVLENFIGETT